MMARPVSCWQVFEPEGSGLPDDASTAVRLSTDGDGGVRVAVGASAVARAWVVRLHLRPGQRLSLPRARAPAAAAAAAAATPGALPTLRHLLPPAVCHASSGFFPFAGAGTLPACRAGAIAEIRLPASKAARRVEGTLVNNG